MTRLNLDLFDTTILLFSWYIKPLFMHESTLTLIQFTLITFAIILYTIFFTIIFSLLTPIFTITSSIKSTSFLSIFMGIKFVILIGLLIVVRGGIPRYRYDFLTKLGWIKTLSLVLAIFLINLLISYL